MKKSTADKAAVQADRDKYVSGEKKKLSPKQKKLDTDKDGKLEGSDFAALRKKKKK